jgi:hypothetical protein
MPMKNVKKWLLALLGLAFAIGFGIWAQSLFVVAELVHFSANFPSDGRAQTMSCCDLGGPWAREHEADWNDYPAGGVLVYGDEGALVMDMGRAGWLKRTLQPYYMSISSHWLRNVGTQPYRIHLDMEMCGMDLTWLTFESAWDAETHTSTRAIEPGETFNMDWFWTVPPELRHRPVVCEGELRISDADSDLLLTRLPIKILDSRAAQ